VQRLVLVGDPHQLGPVVTQPDNILERSLLNRLLDSDLPLFPLNEQHRMNRSIQACVADVYDSDYRPTDAVAGRLLSDLPGVSACEATSRPVLWLDTAGAGLEEQRDPVTKSMFNPGEVKLVGLAVAELRAAGVKPEQIAVLAPYSAQIARLATLPQLEGVEVATVNSFQGREQEAIVCSFVRSNDRGELGFVADGRRLTVALTRAKRHLFCIGNSATLASSPRYAGLLERLEQGNFLQSVWDEPWMSVISTD
jgi:superfamily I DNA and/or RNA helicase